MKTMTTPSWARQPILRIFTLVVLAFGYHQGCATVPDTGTNAPTSDAAPLSRTGFSTWSYQGAPMGLYVPAPTGNPPPVTMYLHACHNDPVDPGHWIIAALNAVEPVAVFLPTAPPSTDSTCSDWGGTYDEALRPSMNNALAELDRLIGEYGFDTSRQYLHG